MVQGSPPPYASSDQADCELFWDHPWMIQNGARLRPDLVLVEHERKRVRIFEVGIATGGPEWLRKVIERKREKYEGQPLSKDGLQGLPDQSPSADHGVLGTGDHGGL